MKLYEHIDRREAVDQGIPIIPDRWVDADKSTDKGVRNMQSRLVAKEIRKHRGKVLEDELLSPMPPWEAIRLVVSHAASSPSGSTGMHHGLMVADVARAYFNAPAWRTIYVDIVPEDREPQDENKCAKLLASMYGTRYAARNLYEEVRHTLIKDLSARVGVAPTAVFVIEGKKRDEYVWAAVHGDDIAAAGPVHILRTS